MKTLPLNRILVVLALCGIGFISSNAIAAQDEFQRQMTQQVLKAKQKLQEAESAKGAERQKLMGEHMKMMKETMEKMQAMKPKTGMSMQEHESWMDEHQKLMNDLMGQMMDEHHLMMGSDCKGMSGDHKH